MRELTSHKVNECNESIKIEVLDEPGHGGACHNYHITWPGSHANPSGSTQILFQNGPIKEVGVNGITHEALLAILIDRLEHFQRGPYACEENGVALSSLQMAQGVLHNRTKRRVRQGVEGTHAKDPTDTPS